MCEVCVNRSKNNTSSSLPVVTELRWRSDSSEKYTYHRSVNEVLRLTAFLLSVDDIEVDFGRVANLLVSIWRNLNKEHVLDKETERDRASDNLSR